MKYFLLYLFLFLVGCMLGYLLEVLFRRIFTAKRWVNPGFMKGPWLPLYGFGLLLMFSICLLFVRFFPQGKLYNPNDFYELGYERGATVYDLIPILSMGLGMTALEFLAGLIFVKGFKVRLWDYSNMKGNLLGIICPQFSLIWLLVSLLFYYAINPFVSFGATKAYIYMFGDESGSDAAHFGFIFFLGVVYGIMLIDFVTSINLFAKISALAKKSGFIARYDEMAERRKIARKEAKEKLLDNLPSSLKDMVLGKPTEKKEEEKLLHRLKAIVLIDPDKDSKDNYTKDGRPLGANEKEEKPQD